MGLRPYPVESILTPGVNVRIELSGYSVGIRELEKCWKTTYKQTKKKNGVLSGYYCHEKKSDILKRTQKEDFLDTWKNMYKNCISEWGRNPATTRFRLLLEVCAGEK